MYKLRLPDFSQGIFPKGGFPKGCFPRRRFPKREFPNISYSQGTNFPRALSQGLFPKGCFPRRGFPKLKFPKSVFPRVISQMLIPKRRFPLKYGRTNFEIVSISSKDDKFVKILKNKNSSLNYAVLYISLKKK